MCEGYSPKKVVYSVKRLDLNLVVCERIETIGMYQALEEVFKGFKILRLMIWEYGEDTNIFWVVMHSGIKFEAQVIEVTNG